MEEKKVKCVENETSSLQKVGRQQDKSLDIWSFRPVLCWLNATTKMLIRVCWLLLSVGVYASYADSSSESTTADDLFGQFDFVFPENFLSKFPEESEFFTVKILAYLFFNIFAKYLGENEPIEFWSKFSRNDFNRVAIDAAFYEYLTEFANRRKKHLIFNPLESSTGSPEDVAIDRIGDYLDNLTEAEVPDDQSETRSRESRVVYYMRPNDEGGEISVQTPFGIPGTDFPTYCDIPKTSFTCANKLVPGIYADIETGCQVFHTCWPHHMDSYLCPIGTTFNQALLTCDFWHESDCYSSPLLFDHSPFAKGNTPRDTEPTIALDDETRTTTESPFTPELDIPEYDGNCQSLMNEPLQLHVKFLPVKCEVTDLKPSTPGTTGESSEYDGKHFHRLMSDFLSGDFKEVFAFIIKAAELGSRMQGAAQRPELKREWPTPKLDSKVVKTTTESLLKNGDVDTTSEEQIYPSATELPSDNQETFPPLMNSSFVEKSVFKATSQKVKHGRSVSRSTLLKPSKPSEDTIKQVFKTMITSLELGGKILNDGLLPLVEKIVLDSRRKKSKS
ncbi:hypothetical protein AVEN_25527-1 [Araneus ventricosus]|uniref:Chitin-binding type-2 domain-containing protein n=1 Tax=Araneus ventricosus TaxID=182803 RepID=A0A4Y2QFL4_ARAVE|nr:hypothetical protein AVEN_25527-1 [Araneus ventricosus]